MTLLARVKAVQAGERPVAAVEGEVDASNVTEIGDLLRERITNQATVLIVDLSAVTYLDSAGINLLFELGADLRARQQELRLVVPPGAPIARALGITGLDVAVTTHPTLAAALA